MSVARRKTKSAGSPAQTFLSAAECRLLSLCMDERGDRDPLRFGLLRALMAGEEKSMDADLIIP